MSTAVAHEPIRVAGFPILASSGLRIANGAQSTWSSETSPSPNTTLQNCNREPCFLFLAHLLFFQLFLLTNFILCAGGPSATLNHRRCNFVIHPLGASQRCRVATLSAAPASLVDLGVARLLLDVSSSARSRSASIKRQASHASPIAANELCTIASSAPSPHNESYSIIISRIPDSYPRTALHHELLDTHPDQRR